MLKSPVPHFYPKMHLGAYWRPFSEIRLDYTSKIWGVNGHTTRCTSPVSVVLWLRLVSG